MSCHLGNRTGCGKSGNQFRSFSGSEVIALHQTPKLGFVEFWALPYKWLAPALVTWGVPYLLYQGWASRCGSLKSYLLFMENDKDERAYQDLVLSNTVLDKNKEKSESNNNALQTD